MIFAANVGRKKVSLSSITLAGGALALGILGAGGSAFASPSWSGQPSWASKDDPAPIAIPAPRKTSYARDTHDSRYKVSPFSPESNNVALDIGQVFLMGDLGNNYADSIGSQLHYTYGVSDVFGFDSSLGYSSHSDGKYSMTTMLTGLRTNLAWYDKVVPYFIFGLGFYKPSVDITPTQSLSQVSFGVHMGPGVDLSLTDNLFFGAALTFHDIFGSSKVAQSGQSVDLGGTFTSFLLHAGVTF